MELFRMTDVISVLELPTPPWGQSSYYVQCPCCDDNPSKKHLNINLKKDVFRCPKCGVSGGVLDLYALFSGVARDKAYRTLADRLNPMGMNADARPKRKPLPKQTFVEEYPITDIETRHATYSALLSKLSLANDHRQNLANRGLTEDEINRLGYKTTPLIGLQMLAKQLRAEGYYLSGVPGFYKTETDLWTFISEKRGILIPVRDPNGLIQGLQIRRDDVQRRKFRWVSSAEKKDGCRAEGWTHFVGEMSSTVILTEGPMKADVIHALSGLTVLAVPGVNTLTQLKIALDVLKERGLKKVMTAFDMDFSLNKNVQMGFNNLLSLLNDMGLKYGTYLWDTRYKGLDDYIWAQKNK